MFERLVSFAAIAALLGACGFQLRGEPEVGIKKIFISSVGPSQVQADIRRAAGIRMRRGALRSPRTKRVAQTTTFTNRPGTTTTFFGVCPAANFTTASCAIAAAAIWSRLAVVLT